jgi:hypothetical protein
VDNLERMRPEPPAPRPRGSVLPVLFIGFLGLVAVGSLLFLTQGWVRGVVLIGAAALGVPLFHYLTWGWWLGKVLKADAEEEA